MIEVVVDSIRISLVSQHRIVVLKEIDSERQLPIWIGPYEADAITIELQDVEVEKRVCHVSSRMFASKESVVRDGR